MSRKLTERIAVGLMAAPTVACVGLAAVVAIALFVKSLPILQTIPLHRLLLGTDWLPARGEFGFYPFMVGTLWVTGMAMALSVPVCLLTAIYLSEYAGRRLRAAAKPLVDLLAGIPSVVYGLWGVLAVVPAMAALGRRAGVATTGYSVLAGGVVLAIMVAPVIISVAQEVLRAVPQAAREASLALGATRWQTVKHVVVPSVLPGVAATVVLGFSRAFGETMAVLMVVGNVPRPPRSVFDPAYPLPALIANNYGEMMSIPRYDAALLLAALLLMLVILVFNVLATVVLRRVQRKLA